MSQQQPGGTSLVNDGVMPWWVRFCRWLWKHPLPFLWFTLIINVAINIGSTWLITPTNTKTIPDTSIAGSITEWVNAHWLFSLLLGTISVALFLLTWQGSRWPESTPSASGQIQMSARDRERMLGRLHVRYEQMLAQSLQGTVLLELGLAESPASIQNAASLALHLPEQAEQILSPHTSIVDIYEQAHQELLILGKPGAGKSTLLIELALHLFKQAEQDAGQALPVLLPLSSWAVKRLPLQDWLIEQFASLYDVPQKLSELWIQADLLLPLLDGLDEMEEAIRPVCIAAINTYHREHLGPLVVCSRTTEYDRAATSERFALHTAVTVQPLSPAQVTQQLVALGTPLAGLRAALKKNASLRELATTPLMLQILIFTYQGTLVKELPSKGSILQQHIWRDYVQRMVERKGDAKHYPLASTQVWLGWLARQMRKHNQTIFSLEYLQPDWLSKRQKAFYQSSIGPFIGGGLGLLIGGIIGLISEGIIWLLIGGSLGLLIGGIIGAIVGLETGLYTKKIAPTEELTWSWAALKSRWIEKQPLSSLSLRGYRRKKWPLPRRSLLVAVGGVCLGLGIEEVWGGEPGVVIAEALMGLLFMLMIVLVSGFSGKQLTERLMFSPNEGIKRSARNGLVGGPLIGLLIGLLIVLFSGPFVEPQSDVLGSVLRTELFFGLFIGPLIGLFLGLLAVAQHYTLRFWLWRARLFPWKAVSFLEDATSRVLLRRIGGGYSFTHRLLLEYFANLDTTTPSPSTGTRPVQRSPRHKRMYYW
jgi:NACHT domain